MKIRILTAMASRFPVAIVFALFLILAAPFAAFGQTLVQRTGETVCGAPPMVETLRARPLGKDKRMKVGVYSTRKSHE